MSGPDTPAPHDLIKEHMGTAVSIAVQIWRTAPGSMELDELKSEAYKGLVMAANRWAEYCEDNEFDPWRLEYFRAFCSRRIRGAVLDFLRASDWASRSLRARHKALVDAAGGEQVSDRELARRTRTSVHQVRATLAGMSARPVSLEVEGVDPGSGVTVEGQVESSAMLAFFVEAVRSLEDQQGLVVVLKYYRGWELREVAGLLGVSESRVSTLHTEALLSLHEKMKDFAERSGFTGGSGA